jgi:hypothetical protein
MAFTVVVFEKGMIACTHDILFYVCLEASDAWKGTKECKKVVVRI